MTVAFAVIAVNHQDLVQPHNIQLGKPSPILRHKNMYEKIYYFLSKIILALPRRLLQRTKDIKHLTLSRHRLHLR